MDLMGDGPEAREYAQATLAPATGQSFDEAFAAGRAKQMAANPSNPGGGTFTWDGKSFHTGIAGEGATKAATTDTTNAAVGTHPPPYDIEATGEGAPVAPAASSLPPAERAAISTQEVVPDASATAKPPTGPVSPTSGTVVAEEPVAKTPAPASTVGEPPPDNRAGAEVALDAVGGGADWLSDLYLTLAQGMNTLGQKGFTRGGPEQDASLRESAEKFDAARDFSEGQLGKSFFDELEKVGGWEGLVDYAGGAARHAGDSFQQFFRPPPPVARASIPPSETSRDATIDKRLAEIAKFQHLDKLDGNRQIAEGILRDQRVVGDERGDSVPFRPHRSQRDGSQAAMVNEILRLNRGR